MRNEFDANLAMANMPLVTSSSRGAQRRIFIQPKPPVCRLRFIIALVLTIVIAL